jgi:hypothetical protein
VVVQDGHVLRHIRQCRVGPTEIPIHGGIERLLSISRGHHREHCHDLALETVRASDNLRGPRADGGEPLVCLRIGPCGSVRVGDALRHPPPDLALVYRALAGHQRAVEDAVRPLDPDEPGVNVWPVALE